MPSRLSALLLLASLLAASACTRPQEVQRMREEAAAATATAITIAARPTPGQTNFPAAIQVGSGPGRLVSIGSHRLYIECVGAGSPTVVLDAGAEPHRRAWDRVLDGVRSFTRICIYDRAGTGASENTSPPRTSQQIVAELRTLLPNAGVTGPYILAGYGFGGLNVRLHASQYPSDVAGLVLLNPFDEDSFLSYVSQLTSDQLAGYLRLATAMGEGLDPVTSALQIAGAPRPRPMPGIVIAPRKGTPAHVHDYLMALSQRVPGSRIIFADDSGQYIHLDQPDLAIGAIRDVVSAVRGTAA